MSRASSAAGGVRYGAMQTKGKDELRAKLKSYGKSDEEIEDIIVQIDTTGEAWIPVSLTEDQAVEFKKPV